MLCYFSFTVQYTETFLTKQKKIKRRKKEELWSKSMVLLVYNFNFIFFLQQNWNLIKSFIFCVFPEELHGKQEQQQQQQQASPSFFNSIFLSYSNYTFFNSIFQEFFFFVVFFLWINTEELFDGDFAIQKRKTSLEQKETFLLLLSL